MKQLIKKYGWSKLSILLLLILFDILLIHNMFIMNIPNLEGIFAIILVCVNVIILGILTI